MSDVLPHLQVALEEQGTKAALAWRHQQEVARLQEKLGKRSVELLAKEQELSKMRAQLKEVRGVEGLGFVLSVLQHGVMTYSVRQCVPPVLLGTRGITQCYQSSHVWVGWYSLGGLVHSLTRSRGAVEQRSMWLEGKTCWLCLRHGFAFVIAGSF